MTGRTDGKFGNDPSHEAKRQQVREIERIGHVAQEHHAADNAVIRAGHRRERHPGYDECRREAGAVRSRERIYGRRKPDAANGDRTDCGPDRQSNARSIGERDDHAEDELENDRISEISDAA
jgi:hypothetical protein